jgi:hypothetical protein
MRSTTANTQWIAAFQRMLAFMAIGSVIVALPVLVG